MSSLQISLAVAGGVVLAALVAHSAWTSRRNAPKQPQPDTRAPEVAGAPVEEERRERFDGPWAVAARSPSANRVWMP
jgi:hypothetical protein